MASIEFTLIFPNYFFIAKAMLDIERLLKQSKLSLGKCLETLDEAHLPESVRSKIPGLKDILRKFDRYEVVLLDDIGYVQQSAEETEVLVAFLAERYERRSLMIASNLVFSQWDKIFKDATKKGAVHLFSPNAPATLSFCANCWSQKSNGLCRSKTASGRKNWQGLATNLMLERPAACCAGDRTLSGRGF